MVHPLVNKLNWRGVFLVISLIVLAYLLTGNAAVQRFDLLLYDNFLNLQGNQISDEVVVVAIDDASLHNLGHWPWSRRVHGQLLDRLTDMGAKAVAFDILFAESDTVDPQADSLFAQAIDRNGRTVLVVAPSKSSAELPISEVLPLSMLAEAAAGLGHVDFEIDRDGLCRSFYLYAGISNAHWPALSLALLQVTDVNPLPENALQHDRQVEHVGWLRRGRFLIPFDPNPEAVKLLSAHVVLNDDEAASSIRGKYVLIGSTATGLGDVMSTPVSLVHQRMPGVVLNAQVLSGLLQGTLIREIDRNHYQVLTILITAIAALLMFNASFPAAMIIFLAAVIGVPAVAGMVMSIEQLWFPPMAVTASLVLGFPLWGVFSHLHARRINRSLSDRVHHQALHHAVTDLPNQYALEGRLNRLGREDGRNNNIAALIIINIQWSDSAGGLVGHSATDLLLIAIAQRLRNAIRSGDMVVHLNGDDFAVLVENLNDADSAQQIANNLLNVLQEPVKFEQSQIFLTPRMGLSLWPQESPDGNALLRDASMAMFSARVGQLTKTCIYSIQVAKEVEQRSQLEQALISAIKRDEFEVYYQPQVITGSSRMIGVEALLRWHNPKLGLVYPSTFIPLAEHTGLIREIGSWVLLSACKQMQQWNECGLGPLRLAVNLSPLQLVDQNLFTEVCETLEKSCLDPSQLELEITESAVMQNLEEAKAVMRALKGLGVKLAIDDFGTGYSSLSNLQHFPLDRIKIDRSFIREIESNDDVREITLTIINMAKRLNLEVIAEGVESESQVARLEDYGCDELQGYYFSHPLPATELTALLPERESFTSVLLNAKQ
ncbi:MAG: EAL domain-containing protein [Candidatus Thiodiazotropha sp. (ex Codakia orbicularis)]|nr:EAL domain-containing protein [Candidatus Thiodiazotropha sp. (ex Codakia orbicularis)]